MKTLGKPFGVVVNRDGIGDDEVFNYCKASDIEVLAKIPNSRKIAELYSNGELIYPEFHEVKSALNNIFEHCQSINERSTV